MLEPGAFGLEGFPSVHLGCVDRDEPHAHVRSVTTAMLPLLRSSPELLVVQGDTSTALGAALAAFTSGVALAHVEAGLRTYDPLLPWPEEEYRAAIDAGADLLFAPTEFAASNLRAENVPGEIHVTGSTGIDAALGAASRLPPPVRWERATRTILVACDRPERLDDDLESIAAALADLGNDGSSRIELLLHQDPLIAANMRLALAGMHGVALLEPGGNDEPISRIRNSDLVLSDSRTIEEIAPALGVPLLVIREKTERPEGIAAGTSRLVGTKGERIVTEVRALLGDEAALAAMRRRALLFGDGLAAGRIATVITDWIQRRSLTRRLA